MKTQLQCPLFAMIYLKETVSDQHNQSLSPSPIHIFNACNYTLPTSPAYSTDSQAIPYLPTSILIHLKHQSSSSPISLPILLDSFLPVISDHQQCQTLSGSQFSQSPTILSYIHVATSAPPSITYDVFHRSSLATAMTQGLSDVCDPKFKPKRGDPHEQQLFTEKQNFVYAVLLKTLHTDYGRGT